MFYIDDNFRCHASNPNGVYREIKSNIFEGKCTEYIEGYRYIPAGESWERSDGIVFAGEMVAPWKPYEELDAAQREYERQQIAEYEANLAELDALVLNFQYNNLIGEL